MRTPRFLVLLLALLALLFAACGGDDDAGGDDGGGAAGEDVNALLDETFSGSKAIESGKFSLALDLEAEGAGAEQLQGPVKLTLSGPFDASDQEEMPKFALQASFQGAGQSLEAGATSTGDKGFLSFQGTNYVASDEVWEQFKTSYQEAREQAEGQEEGQSLATLGMDPRAWLVDPKNEGSAKVGDDDTVKITAGVDVGKMLDDVNKALESAASLGVQGSGQIPEKLTDEQRRQVTAAVKDPRVEIYTGAEDKILRRMVVNLGLEDSGTSGTLGLDLSITDLNEGQDIAEPEDAQPLDQLLGQLGGLGLGAAGAGAGSADDGAAAGGTSAEAIEEYSQCIADAGSDVDKTRACADLLAP